MNRFHSSFIAFLVFISISSCSLADDEGWVWRFTMFGDSLTAQNGGAGDKPFTSIGYEMWPALMGSYFGQHIRPYDKGGTNYAYPGKETGDILSAVSDWQQSGGVRKGIVFVNGGGNDIMHAINKHILDPDIARHILRASNRAVSNLGLIERLVASNMNVELVVIANMPSLGSTPLAHALGMEGALGEITKNFNSSLGSNLSIANREGKGDNLLIINWEKLLDEIFASYTEYGFGNITKSGCSDSITDLNGPCPVAHWERPDAPTYYFFMDALHPGGAAEKVMSEYAISLFEAPFIMSTLSRIPEGKVLSSSALINNVLSSIGASKRGVTKNYLDEWIFTGSLSHGDSDLALDSRPVSPVSYTSNDVNFGWTYLRDANSPSYSGLSMFFSSGSGNLNGDDSSYLMNWFGAVAYHQQFVGKWLLTGKMGAAGIRYPSISREITLGKALRHEVSRTDGYGAWGEISAFYPWKSSANLTYGPIVNALYRYTFIQGFSEEGASSTSMRFLDQKRYSLLTGLGWSVKGNFSVNGHGLNSFFSFFVNRENIRNRRYVYASLISAPSIFHVLVDPVKRYSANMEVGFSGDVNGYTWALGGAGGVYLPALGGQFSVNLSLSRKFL